MGDDKKDTSVNITISTPMAIVIAGTLIGIAIYASNNANRLNNGSTAGADVTQGGTLTPQPTPVVSQVGIDDDPVLGNPDAPVTLIEFSDYECPFCKSYFTQSFTQLKKDYIDTGKVKVVFRDLPLTIHDPLANQEALTLNCAREQGGDDVYWQYHDQLFTQTTSNGTGITADELYAIGTDLGLNRSKLVTCVDNGTYQEEINNDIADAQAALATATPTFFVGVSTDDGVISGTRIVGAQPYTTVIKPIIESALAEAES